MSCHNKKEKSQVWFEETGRGTALCDTKFQNYTNRLKEN